jgi:hypothetical protein
VPRFEHTFLSINQVPPQEDIDHIRPIMDRVESAVETSCGLSGFSMSIVEECSGVTCDGN